MDINDVRSVVTLIGLACFVLIVVWAYSSASKKRFEEAAMLPFDEDDEVAQRSTAQPR